MKKSEHIESMFALTFCCFFLGVSPVFLGLPYILLQMGLELWGVELLEPCELGLCVIKYWSLPWCLLSLCLVPITLLCFGAGWVCKRLFVFWG